MLKYSDLYPLSIGGGANIAGFEWSEKTSDFTAIANRAYYCDTALGDILMTLPASPSNGDEVGFLLIGANKVNITTTDKIEGNLLATDYAKQVATNYLLIILTYVDGTTGWNWDARYNSSLVDAYIGLADPYLNATSLLLQFNGTNGGTTITDTSPTPKTVTNSGVILSATQVKEGSSSAFFSGDTTQLAIVNGLGISSGDFTIECWFYRTTSLVKDLFGASSINGWVIFARVSGTTLTSLQGMTGNVPLNEWCHYSLCRSGTTIRLFINGNQTGIVTGDSGNYVFDTLYIGRGGSGGDYRWIGYIDSFRVVTVAVRTANFIP